MVNEMGMEYTVLVCDDDADIVSAIRIYLSGEGYHVLSASNGEEAVEAVRQQPVHLVLLDVMMPVMDGIQAAAKIRAVSNAPILFLSAKSEDADRILGLAVGGDDYITKPFNPAEMIARVRAALRRYARLGGMEKNGTSATAPASSETGTRGIFQTGGLVVDDNLKRVEIDGEEVTLTATEYNIVLLLISHLDRVFSSAQIYEAIWGGAAYGVAKTVSVHMRHIRQKIEINPKEPQYLKVIYGLGYKMVRLA
jgi:DNA-binding response OmpR family regulator